MSDEIGRRGGSEELGDSFFAAREATNRDTPELYEFGPYRLEPNERKLWRGNEIVELTPKTFDTLVLLVRNSGHLLEKEELIRMLWPDTFVEEGSLSNNIFLLRKALGEEPPYIETVPKRGYRFVGAVRQLPNAVALRSEKPLDGQCGLVNELSTGPRPPNLVLPTPTTVPAPKRRALVIGGLLSLLLAVTVLWWLAAHRISLKAHPTEQRLTANPPDIPIRWAALSPDGKYLAYWDRTGLFLSLISTGETHPLNLPSEFTDPPFRYFNAVLSAGWFPDSSALLVTPAGQPESIWSVSVLGGSPKKLMENGEARAVSPDGSQIAFVRGVELPQSVWVMNVDGSRARKLIGQVGDLFGAVAWSPDSHKLAFVRYRPSLVPQKTELGTYNFDTGGTNSILYDPGLLTSVAWTRDNRLIYSLQEPRPNLSDSNLWAIPVDPRTGAARGPAQRLTDGPDLKSLVSVSDSGKALTYARLSFHAHMYVVKVPRRGENNEAPTRMNLDEGNNYPFTWTPDGDSVIFVSDRGGGIDHLYKQSVHQLAPDLLVGGDEPVRIARISPDRSEILYELEPQNGKQGGPTRILAMAVNGGSPREVLRGDGIGDFQCARGPANVCIMAQSNGETTQFSTFDPKTGVEKPALTIHVTNIDDSFSPDGTTLAVALDYIGGIPGEIQLYNLRDASHTTLKLMGWKIGNGIDWNPDGKSLWVHARTSKGVAALVNLDLQGNVTPLFEDTENRVGWAIPSPDGSRLAYWKQDLTSNVWLLRDF